MELNFIQGLLKPAQTKIVMLILDGIGGLPRPTDNKTELEAAETPHLDALAKEGICGLHQPIATGITPGSGPGHLGLFGYNPLSYQVGRGVLAALGINFDLQPHDVAARGNFCTLDENGLVTDRRAGRISTEKNRELCKLLRTINLPDVEVFVETVKEHRFLLVLRGKNLHGSIADTDPQETGHKPLPPRATSENAQHTAELISIFLQHAQKKLADHHPANMVLLRGFSQKPSWPSFNEAYGLKSAAIAGYPMYRGLAKLLDMTLLDTSPDIHDEITVLEQNWEKYDFFFIHVKPTDSAGEDGDFDRKTAAIEEVDKHIPRIRTLHPDVIIVTGDHSTPAQLKYHSWHPVPLLLWSKHCRTDPVKTFGERTCITGGLGPRFPAVDIMPLALANAQRLEKYGA